MSELMGILDALEALVQAAGRVPLTGKVMIEEYKLIQVVNKLRMAVQSGESMIRKSIEVGQLPETPSSEAKTPEFNALPMIQDAMTKSEQIRSGANNYAQDVLAQLQLVVAKMHKDITKIERNIDKGREVLDQQKTQIKMQKDEDTDEI